MSGNAAIIGAGVIGAGWCARFLLNGWNVTVSDPNPAAEQTVLKVLEHARRAFPQLHDMPLPPAGQLRMASSLAEAVEGADWVQESIPERLDIKLSLYAEIEPLLSADAVIGSSTSGFTPTQLRAALQVPQRLVVAHPFNPVYLLPLVELVAGDNSLVVDRASSILRSIGMHPLLVRAEIDAHLADRFLEAVWREALWLIRDDIATTEEIDDAIRLGFGLRWAQMGLFETYRIAGGEAGMAHFIEQFGPCLSWPWTRLTDVPELTPELVDKIARQSDQQSGRHTIRELECIRDANLVAILRALKRNNQAAGFSLNQHDEYLRDLLNHDATESTLLASCEILDAIVMPEWKAADGTISDPGCMAIIARLHERLLSNLHLPEQVDGQPLLAVVSHLQRFNTDTNSTVFSASTRVESVSAAECDCVHTISAGSEGQAQMKVATCRQTLIASPALTRSLSWQQLQQDVDVPRRS